MGTTAPSGTITFVFTDIEGSTRLWADHPGRMRPALARHDEIVRDTTDECGGYLFAAAGDSFGVAFDRARVAVRFAELVQDRISVERWPEPVEIRVRIGLHTGEADERGATTSVRR